MARAPDYPVNVSTFGPDGETIDSIQSSIAKATVSCHEAIERGDWQQVKALANCLASLTRTLNTMRYRGR